MKPPYNNKGYRKLTRDEIKVLEAGGCTAQEWERIEVKDGFNPERCRNVRFSGDVSIGAHLKTFHDESGVAINSGIENALIHNCVIGDNVSVFNIGDYIANCFIGDEAVIRNCGKIYAEGVTTFGNGTEVDVISEAGGRTIRIFDHLSSHLAYIVALYRHRPALIDRINKLTSEYAVSVGSNTCFIGNNVKISGCSHLRNVKAGPYARLEGVLHLNEGSLNSTKDDPVYVGPGVIMENFIVSSGSCITEAVMIERCFIGQGCVLGKQFSAHNSLFFANSQGFHGEVYSVFAGPYTVTHHKSTLLIAGIFSFMNAGSGSNQSNHMYKLGPVHQGVVERGTKTASDSYLLWPAHIGPYSLVTGRHLKNIDTSLFPFSYIIENNRESILVPGMNLVSTGTIRDSQKWPLRDRRKDGRLLDFIHFGYLSPFTAGRMIKGIGMLKSLRKRCEKEKETEFCIYNNNLKINFQALERGILFYRWGTDRFIGDMLTGKISGKEISNTEDLFAALESQAEPVMGDWIDLAGLLAPAAEVSRLLDEIEGHKINSVDEITERFRIMHESYPAMAWSWVKGLMEQEKGKPFSQFTPADLVPYIERWKESIMNLNERVLEDAGKEFSGQTMTGFGADWGGEAREADYFQVRGTIDSNPVVESVKSELETLPALAGEIIKMLKRLA